MDISLLVIASVFLAGLLSFFSPCIFPVLPVYLGILLDHEDKHTFKLFGKQFNWYSLMKTLAFIAGLSTVFITLGYGAGFLGDILYRNWFRILLGLFIILLGLHQMDIFTIKRLQKQKSFTYHKKENRNELLSAFLLGLTFSFGWTPCVGPVLSSVLGLAAAGGNGSLTGGIYMLFYTLGLAIPFLLLAITSSALLQHFNKLRPYIPLMKKIGGVLIIFMGILIMTGSVNAITAFFENLFNH
ncbi:thiol-disulfide oxidoreductase-associated membrane protein CcdA2 [Streptococcus didelphis]|uniref:Thiol-disulfide oxidoreductase-associated membrane protein CcdA2 n=1 Tax=Streptococcus didelphis TaxID=102886 RepID=A0ABY9LHR6_9STRE|nr:thiol-disulfide oxidoreductase-associated membrane protein CcdA2 [Streptococcus didelphis]WMB28417.1 thiol-disulfide oxidoreductase-associated membrane protein CcdA2 [Streptococcus didelphis]